jgi:hypothetical protein
LTEVFCFYKSSLRFYLKSVLYLLSNVLQILFKFILKVKNKNAKTANWLSVLPKRAAKKIKEMSGLSITERQIHYILKGEVADLHGVLKWATKLAKEHKRKKEKEAATLQKLMTSHP